MIREIYWFDPPKFYSSKKLKNIDISVLIILCKKSGTILKPAGKCLKNKSIQECQNFRHKMCTYLLKPVQDFWVHLIIITSKV